MRVLLIAAVLAGSGPAAAETLAIVHARAVTVSGPQVDDATILVADGKIQAVGAGLPSPGGARVIDAQGRIVTPGLMNAGTELGLVEVASVPDTMDPSVTSGPLGAAFDVQHAINANSILIPIARADGMTRAGSYPGDSAGAPFLGQGVALRLSEGPDVIDRPRAMMFARFGGMAAKASGGSRAAAWLLVRNALDEARRFRQASARGGPRDQLLNHLDAEALQPVISGAMPLAVVAERESDIREAVRLGEDFRVRIVIFGGAEAWRAADLLAARHIPVVIDAFDDLPATFDETGARLDNAALLQKAGVKIAFTAPGIQFSHNAGSAAREAAGLAVANGLPWADALRALTINPAEIWSVADHYGSIAPGLDADLVIWDGDPLEPSSAPAAVFVRGREVSRVNRQTALRDRYAPSRSADSLPPAYR